MTDSDVIERHYVDNWGPALERIRPSGGRIDELPEDFGVLGFARPAERMIAYGTCGMSQADDAERLELHLFTRETEEDVDSQVELLTVVAHYHRTGARLGLGHTVYFGRPWVAGSACTHGLLSLPYLDGPALEWLEQPPVRFLWLIPITPTELAFAKHAGIEALESRFEESEFDYLDPYRAAVA